jgi:TolB protein
VVNSDGTDQQAVTNNPYNNEYISWSPNGAQLMYQWGTPGTNELGVSIVNADGSGDMALDLKTTQVSWSPDGQPIAVGRRVWWSPDGQNIAFISGRNEAGFGDLHVMRPDGTGSMRLTQNGAEGEVSWSPDGTRMAFVSLRDGNREIYIVNVDGTGERNITNNPENDYNPRWQPAP